MKDKKLMILPLLVLGIFFLLSGISYAIHIYSGTGNIISSITADGVLFSYKEGPEKINITDTMWLTDSNGKKQDKYFEFYISAKTDSSMELPYYISLRKTSTSDNIDDVIRLYLTKVDANNNEEEVKLVTYNDLVQYENQGIDLSKYTEKLLYSDKVSASSKYMQKYRLRMWIGENVNFFDPKYQNAKFGITVNVYSSAQSFLASNDLVEESTIRKVNIIRNTGNTDISNRTGKIFYVSNTGSDSNDGLSSSNPIKTISKLQEMLDAGTIKNSDTILFNDGDVFRGNISLNVSNILIGTYGDISKGKPTLTASLYDGAREGNWVEVKPNIWKYTYNNDDQVFKQDVGTLWMFCNEENNNCTKSMTTIDRKFEYAIKVTSLYGYDETDLDSKIDTLLTKDLEFYHAGHANADNKSILAGALYLYSTSNPATRFNEIEFAVGVNEINTPKPSLYVDNINIFYVGNHGIGTFPVSNLVVTNSEIGFIGGSTHGYNKGKVDDAATRYGNGIQVYGAVWDVKGEPVVDGFVVDNCYIYQCYDTGVTFQYTPTGNGSPMEKAVFSNNVLEYSNYNIEYWVNTASELESDQKNTYIKDFDINNNILRYSGYGICETRPEKEGAADIKTWYHSVYWWNKITGDFLIRNNIFANAKYQHYYARSGSNTSPVLTNNTFYNTEDGYFGYDSNGDNLDKWGPRLAYDPEYLSKKYPNNNFVLLNKSNETYKSENGTTGNATWAFDLKTNTLTISGNGSMADYTADNLAPWYKFRKVIYTVVIGENVTKIGDYAFYNLTRVETLKIKAKTLANLPMNNKALYRLGRDRDGISLIFDTAVTVVPDYLFRTSTIAAEAPNITSVQFKGTKVTRIGEYGLAYMRTLLSVIPDSVTEIGKYSLGYGTQKSIVLPDSITTIPDYLFNGAIAVRKIIFGPAIDKISDNTFRHIDTLKLLVIPSIDDPNGSSITALDKVTTPLTIYGNSSTEAWVNRLIENGKTNITYSSLDNYTSTISSNVSTIKGTASYNGTFTFETDKTSVKAYYRYIDDNGFTELVSIPVEKNGNQYTISNIKYNVLLSIK